MDTFREQGKYNIWTLNELVRVTEVTCHQISPSSSLLAIVSQRCLKVYKLDHKKYCREELLVYYVDFNVEDIKWSPDSKALLIMCSQDRVFLIVQFDSGEETVYRFKEPETVGLLTIEWVPDSKHVVSVSKHDVYAFVHSVLDGQRILLPPISSSNDGKPLMAFSPNEKYLAIVNVSNLVCYATLISTRTWNVLWKSKLDLLSVQGLEWCPKSSLIALWDHFLTISFLELSGETMHSIRHNTLRRACFVTTMFSPNSELYIAACRQDDEMKILLFNLNVWKLSTILNHLEDRNTDGLKKEHSNVDEGAEGTSYHPLTFKNQLTISHCGGLLVSSLVKGLVVIWNLRNGCEVMKAFEFPNRYVGLLWHVKKNNLYLAIDNGDIILWKPRQECLIPHKAGLESVHLNLGTVQSLLWSKRKLVVCCLKQPLCTIISSRTDR